MSADTLFYLSGIPTIQVGHEPFNDVLIKNGLCPSVISSEQLLMALREKPKSIEERKLFALLGIRKDWKNILLTNSREKDD